MKIALGTLKDNGNDLVAFLEPRIGAKPTLSGDSVEIEDESIRKGVKPRDVKTYIKRFLFMKGMRKNYRIFVNGTELTVQEIELGEEEAKEEEKPAPEPEAPKEEAAEPEEEGKAPKQKKSPSKKARGKKKAEEEA